MRSYLLKLFVVFSFFFSASDIFSADFSVAHRDLFEIKTSSLSYLPFQFEIPEGSYIYGNPKGPGVGKPVLISARWDDGSEEKIFIDQPEKYFPENSPEWIYRYEGGKKFYVSLNGRRGGMLSIALEALMCGKGGYCQPVSFKKKVQIKISDSASALEKPSGAVAFQSSLPENKIGEIVSIPYVFNPVFVSGAGIGSFAAALFWGLLAGIILNFMPCVLPVIGIKLLGIINSCEGNRSHTAKVSLSFAGGIFFSFGILAAFVSFAGYSWGSLFQNELFVKILAFVVFSMALAMLGVFSINQPFSLNVPSAKYGKCGSAFFQGCIATLLATPCSGPFLGGTLAWALSQSTFIIFAIFAGIAFGMSLPYVFLAVFPKALRLIPKNGPWTLYLERAVGFLLLATVVYLLSVYSSLGFSATPVLFALLVLGVALWQFGIFGSTGASFRKRIISYSFLILAIALSFLISRSFDLREDVTTNTPFSVEALLENEKQGKIVAVEFTADWCPNCAYVEKFVLSDPGVLSYIARNGVVQMKADITSSGSEAELLLNKLGSRSIPFFAVFIPGKEFSSPICLRDIYSKKQLMTALENAVERKKKSESANSIGEEYLQFDFSK